MSEKPETDEFDDDVDEAVDDGDDVDLDRAAREMEMARRRGNGKAGIPALRRLELLMEQKRTAELTSDFDDYDLDSPLEVSRGGRRSRAV